MKTFIISILVILFYSSLIAQNDVEMMIIARNQGEKELENGEKIRVFGFSKELNTLDVPGPIIYANEGDSVHIDLFNMSQGAPHTIHLHGLDVNQQNDGVPHLSFEVAHMDHGFYHFKAPHAGTYLYHCHVASTIHVQAGMYGMVIIYPPDSSQSTWDGGYSYAREIPLLFSELDLEWHTDEVLDHKHDTSQVIHEVTIPKFEPEYFLINGLTENQIPSSPSLDREILIINDEIAYLRLANIGFYGNRLIFPENKVKSKIISSDGRPLPKEELTDTVIIYPGERYGVLLEALDWGQFEAVVEYFDLNTNEVKGTQLIPLDFIMASRKNQSSDLQSFYIFNDPNQNNTYINFDLKSGGDIEIQITDIKGKILNNKILNNLHPGKHQYLIGNEIHSSGVYIVQLYKDGYLLGAERFIK